MSANLNIQCSNGTGDVSLLTQLKSTSVVDYLAGAVSAILTYCLFRTPRAESIHSAAQKGEMEKIKLLIQQGVDVNARDYEGNTPLYFAVDTGKIATMQLLIKSNANVHAINHKGMTPLHLAALRGNKDAVELLINRNANVHATNNMGNTPLHLAVLLGNKDAVELLINRNSNVHATTNEGNTPLHLAVLRGNKDAVELLIKSSADVNATNNEGIAPLHLSATQYYLANTNQKIELIKLLIEKNADVNAKTKTGITALHLTAMHKDIEATKLLIEKKADVNAKTMNMTMLDVFVAGHGLIARESINQLEVGSANTKIKDITPLHMVFLLKQINLNERIISFSVFDRDSYTQVEEELSKLLIKSMNDNNCGHTAVDNYVLPLGIDNMTSQCNSIN